MKSQNSSDLKNSSGKKCSYQQAQKCLGELNPSEIMNVRWLAEIQKEIPAIDFEDLNI